LKELVLNGIIISFAFCISACSDKRVKSVLDDISRDTYENTMRKRRIDNKGDPTYAEPPSYDQYQSHL
jgi:hypothetical protein